MTFKDVAHHYLNTGLIIAHIRDVEHTQKELNIDSYFMINTERYDEFIKPIMYSLDYLTKPIVHDGEEFVPLMKLSKILHDKQSENFDNETDTARWIEIMIDGYGIEHIPFWITDQLIKWHFNLWLEKEQYIDKSTIK